MSSNATSTKTWLITGAGRGMGVDFAQAALAAGHNVVATGRNPDAVRSAVGGHEKLLVAKLDITDEQSAAQAVAAAIERFGRLDVLVNNAGNFFGGFLRGVEVRRGGLDGGPGRRGAAVRIRTMIVEPGFFRTELLEPESTAFADLSIDDYADRTAETIPAWQAINGRQAGDPAKLARALVELADGGEPPLRWVAGEDAVEGVEQKARLLLAQVSAYRSLSTDLAHDDARVAA